MKTWVIVSLFVLLAAAGAANCASISGIVTTPKGVPARDAVISLEGAVTSTPLAHAMIDQRGKQFIPHVLVVTKGTRVDFPNSDNVLHNVFAYYNAKRFDLGEYPRGTSRRVTFDKTGVVALLCNIHSNMSAYILVVDTPYFAVTDSNGKFEIDGVSAGSYTLQAWHESGASAKQQVEVSGSQSVNVALKRT